MFPALVGKMISPSGKFGVAIYFRDGPAGDGQAITVDMTDSISARITTAVPPIRKRRFAV